MTNKSFNISAVSILVLVLFLINQKNKKLAADILKTSKLNSGKSKNKKTGNVDWSFVRNLSSILKIAFPSFFSKLTLELLMMVIALVFRTLLSIQIATINGSFARAVVDRNLKSFVQKILKLLLIAIPASVLNSYLEFLRKSIGFKIRENMNFHFHSLYMDSMKFYQISNIDSRIENIDQRLTNDVEKFSTAFANLFSNFTKPFLDVFLFGRTLGNTVGYKTISMTFIWYFFSGIVIKTIAPPIGLLTAVQQNHEGNYRALHSNVVSFSQEIAFLNGGKFEKQKLKEKYEEICSHEEKMLLQKFYLGFFNEFLVKYGATVVATFVLAKPSINNFNQAKNKLSVNELTQSYISNSSLMINLARSIGRLVSSYKDIQAIAGYSVLITEYQQVMKDLSIGKYQRTQVENKNANRIILDMKSRGVINISADDGILFDKVPLVTPSGDLLVDSVSFELKKGENLIISGPNGCGKSSLFRIMGGLWPITGGRIERPPIEDLFYLPQRPYITEGTLKEQIIYPDANARKEVGFQEIHELLSFVGLEGLVESKNEACLEEIRDWDQVLSGGEKQMIAMARLLYHKPKFAILDECTSSVSLEMEAKFYKRAKEIGVALFTISHRVSLFQYHDFFLKFDGEGGYEWIDLSKEPEEAKIKRRETLKNLDEIFENKI